MIILQTFANGESYASIRAKINANFQALITYTDKPAIVDADIVLGSDSVTPFGLASYSWTNIKIFLKAYFDQLYATVLGNADFYKYTIVKQVVVGTLTVFLKNYAGNDPTPGAPVKIQVGTTVWTITSALSGVHASGTPVFNLNSTELSGTEVDLFVYIGKKTSGGFLIGLSRMNWIRYKEDFSLTLNNERAASYLDQLDAGDAAQNIGRINVIQTASVWSLPATASLITEPCYQSRTMLWNPVYTGFSANPGNNPHYYRFNGTSMSLIGRENNAGTSNATTFTKTTPFACKDLTLGSSYSLVTLITDNSADSATPGYLTLPTASPGNLITVSTTILGGAWTASGTKRVKNFQLVVEV